MKNSNKEGPVIRVLIVDDQAIVRKGISALLALVEDIEIVGEAGDGLNAVGKTDNLLPDVVISNVA